MLNPKPLENMKCTESSRVGLSAARGCGCGMPLNQGIPGQLAQEPQSLAKNPLRAESSLLMERGELQMQGGSREGWEPPWIPPQAPPKLSEQPEDKGTNCKVKLFASCVFLSKLQPRRGWAGL